MGGSLSRLWSFFWTKKEIRILILGLDNAGKTTLLYRLKIGEVVTTIPTIGFNVESVTYRNLNFNVWDLGGQTSIRPYWRCYYANTAAVIFVIDSTDIERLGTAADELAAMLNEEELRDAALLVFANKQDQPGAKGAGEISEALKLGELRDRNWSIVACSAIDGKGLDEGMDWLVNVPGTFQQFIVSPAEHVTIIPPELDPDTAAPLLCAGIAMYSSIMKTKTRPGDWIAILGAGGGLGHMGIQIAVKKGLKVIAIDSGDKKRELCLSLGATDYFDYKKDDIAVSVTSVTRGLGAHAVICTANSESAYIHSMQMLRSLGVLVCVGIPNEPFRLPSTPLDMIVKGLTIVGNSAGTAKEMEELLSMAVAGDVKAHIECFDFSCINDVLQRLERAEIDGRAVLKIPE
ncbi:hypothetical protein LV164_004958 [Aspergillus fumigatus]|nr:hypothetical protein LV157_000772 [Aspergillus fumigatus]KAJ8206205.1 hypothetical protein LV164_004958 [Aspergillus fumigatus]